jgi:DNA-binding transcriptional MerR regulator
VESTADVAGQTGENEIPDRLYFRIGDVSRLAGVKPYVLRFWETEFPAITPKKSGTGQRLYRRKDVELIFEIKHLLYEKRFTIEGARKAIEKRRTAAPSQIPLPMPQQEPSGDPAINRSTLRHELEQILRILS